MSRRTLLPREHGAYAQLGAPLVAALVMRAPTLAAGWLAAAAIAAFLANEPLLVALGHRGRRARELDGARAWRRLGVLGIVALGAGIAGLALANTGARVAAGAAALPAAALLVLGVRRAQHSLAGEVMAAIALPALAVPVAIASGTAHADAVIVWLAWSLGFAASVVAVHRVIARHRAPAARLDRVLAAALVAVLVAICGVAGVTALALVAAPLLASSAALVVKPPRASHLRAIGVALVVASAASIAVAVAIPT
jgi:hypothetical protein